MTTARPIETEDDLWAPRRQLTLAQARRRSKRVAALRFALAGIATICLAILAGHLAANAIDALTRNDDTGLGEDEMAAMLNPRFTGRDSRGQFYVITAETARQSRDDDNVIGLTNPKMVDAEGTEVTAPRGLYDRTAQILELYEDVQVVDSSGYTFTSTHARIYVREDRVEGIDPLTGRGPMGEVRADTYEILENGDVVVMRGNVQTTIIPETRPAEPTTAPDGDQTDRATQDTQEDG